MKCMRLALLFCLGAGFSFGASKEIVELQRDVAILQDQVRQVQRTLDEKLSQLMLLTQQAQDNSSKANSSLSGLQTAVSQSVGEQLQPVLKMGTRMDGLADEVHGLKDSISDLSTRMARLDAKVTDLGNQIKLAQNPPAAPGADQGAAGAQAAGPPAGLTAEAAWTAAERDRFSGNADLALKEYKDYLTYFGNTDYAPTAQYYIGEIYFNRGDFVNALAAFDTQLEHYPENAKTVAAHYMKGQVLERTGQPDEAVKEFRVVIAHYPGTEYARKSAAALRALGASPGAKPSPTRRRR